ncbi:MAG: methyltransferase [Salibacteraceae bacterium]
MSRLRKVRRRLFKLLFDKALNRHYNHYSSKNRVVSFKGIKIQVNTGIFNPSLFFSTKVLVKYASRRDLNKKRILELGCGTGAFSCWAAKQGAHVIASDINPEAVENAKHNATLNNLEIKTVQSDLFENLNDYDFDWVVINPPYYPQTPKTDADKAWFCGKEFEYFEGLFNQLAALKTWKRTIMVLSEDCDIDFISNLAIKNNLNFKKDFETATWVERNYIFRISKKC